MDAHETDGTFQRGSPGVDGNVLGVRCRVMSRYLSVFALAVRAVFIRCFGFWAAAAALETGLFLVSLRRGSGQSGAGCGAERCGIWDGPGFFGRDGIFVEDGM